MRLDSLPGRIGRPLAQAEAAAQKLIPHELGDEDPCGTICAAMSANVDQDSLLVKAYARLKALRDNLPTSDTYAPRVMLNDFNRALDDLGRAGFDASDFGVTDQDLDDAWGVPSIQSTVLRARLDAVLIFFRINHDTGPTRAKIGFDAPRR